MNEIGANPARIEAVKPNECEPPDLCPCAPFLKCNSRLPYGTTVWSAPENRKKAMGVIAYSSKNGSISDMDSLEKMAEKFTKRNTRNDKKYKNYNRFLANLYPLVGDPAQERVLTLPAMTEEYIKAHMNTLKESGLYNTAGFSNFQRAIFVRTNLVRNNFVMRSDIYIEEGETKFGSREMIPYCGVFSKEQWSVDHIQTRSKGGCNRFCNGALLTIGDNIQKRDDWPGCPCFNCEQQTDGQTKYVPKKNSKKDTIYECQYLYKANQDKRGRKLPLHPPALIKNYSKICALDDPCNFSDKINSNVEKEINKVRK